MAVTAGPGLTNTITALKNAQLAQSAVLVIGSQALTDPDAAMRVADAVTRMSIPVYLSGMARGLLGPDAPLQMRHPRRQALREADCVVDRFP